MPQFDGVTIERDPAQPRIARLRLDRPARLNAIHAGMPPAIRAAVAWAEGDEQVHVIVVEGAGRAFCAGYDLVAFAQGASPGTGAEQPDPWDPMVDYALMKGWTEDFMSLWRCAKPTIAKVHGHAVAGGSDIALCCDLLVMAEDARIGYMPARVWGCPTTAMWAYRLGPLRAKQLLFTGDTISGAQAAAWGLANLAVPADELDAATFDLVQRATRGSAMSKGLGKHGFYAQIDLDQPKAYAYTIELMASAALTDDAQEGIAAFLEKRKPSFGAR